MSHNNCPLNTERLAKIEANLDTLLATLKDMRDDGREDFQNHDKRICNLENWKSGANVKLGFGTFIISTITSITAFVIGKLIIK